MASLAPHASASRVSAVLFSIIFGLIVRGQAVAQEDVDLSAGTVESADVVVIGKLVRVWSYPWIDGWHERGKIALKEVLFGHGDSGQELSFGWEHSFGWDCLRPDWSAAENKGEISASVRD